ncbi:MAG: SpoIID/LytB domain-containing protein [Phormidesmis sp.]
MLKQPLLSRMFKLSEATSSSATDRPSENSAFNLPSPKKQAPETTESETLEPEATESETAGSEAQISEAQAPEAQSRIASLGLSAKKIAKKISASAESDPKRKRLSAVAIGKGLAIGGVLLTASGSALVRYAPTTLQAALLPSLEPVAAPLSLSGDPSAELVTSTGELFLTNQILYRKLEAIAGVTLSIPAPATDLAAADSSKTTKPGDGTAKADPKPAKADKDAEDAEPDLDKQVVAAAPPAPAIAPVEFSGTTIDSVLEMRVALAKDVPAIGFATSGGGVITDLDGNTLKELSPERGVTAAISGGIVVEGQAMPSAFWVYPEDGGYVAVGDSWYRGRVLVALRDRGLIAVNYVLLGDYLYSVVGSEMSPSWAIESLKAQAIAARSYALTHNIRPASQDYFDLDNTPRFQAYKGISREASTTQAAVLATAGEFISHQGGIVESLYAASQAIVDDAHSGSGMSQLGAKDLAEQGYSYQEILAHYYPGTALGRLETDHQ